MSNAADQFFAGVRLLGRGLAICAGSPGLFLLGMVPALITGLLYLGGFIVLVIYVSDLAEWATWFADDWSEGLRDAAQFLAAIGLIGLAGLLGVLTYTALTLLVGDPFYEKISGRVEDRFGGVPGEVEVTWWRSLGRSLADSVRLVLLSVLVGIPLFFAGLIPVFGQTVVPVLGALVGGWLLAVEMVGAPFARRGLRLSDRRRVLRVNRPLALGFGVSVFLCFLVPLGAVLIMPAAVAGAALLTRRVLDPAPGMPASGVGRPRP